MTITKGEHSCEYYEGKISDVTFRNGGLIFCRRCGKELSDSEVNEKVLKEIRSLKKNLTIK